MRRFGREPIQKISTALTVKQPGLAMGDGGHHERVEAAVDDHNRGKERLPEFLASTGVNPKSTSPPRESSAKGLKTNLSVEKERDEKALHEYGKVPRENKKLESISPIRGKDSLEATTPQKVLGEEMHWESADAQSQIPLFVFNGSLEACGAGNVVESERPKPYAGPMAMSYSNEMGWTAKVLGPKSGHWKRKAREALSSSPKVNTSQNVIAKAEVSKSKRESSIPLQELDQNISVLKRVKKGKSSNTQGEKGSIKDGGEAATAM